MRIFLLSSLVRSLLHSLRFNYHFLPRDCLPLPCAHDKLLDCIDIFFRILFKYFFPLCVSDSIRHEKSAYEYYPFEWTVVDVSNCRYTWQFEMMIFGIDHCAITRQCARLIELNFKAIELDFYRQCLFNTTSRDCVRLPYLCCSNIRNIVCAVATVLGVHCDTKLNTYWWNRHIDLSMHSTMIGFFFVF